MNIAIGDAATGIAAVVSEDGSNVQSVGLGNVNGVTLGYQNGTGQGEAKAAKDGGDRKPGRMSPRNTTTISST